MSQDSQSTIGSDSEFIWASLVIQLVKKTFNAGDTVSVPVLRRYPRGGNSSPFQYSCLENPMDRGVWWATVYSTLSSQVSLQTLHNS